MQPSLGFQSAYVLGLLAAALPASATAVSLSLASYEADETTLSISPAGGDAGLQAEIVDGGVDGAPAATDGTRIVKLTITNETDRKVEYRHFWTGPHYDLDGADRITADVYIADSGAIPGIVGLFEYNWDPPNAWRPGSNLPITTNTWTTVNFGVLDHTQTDQDRIWAFVFENLAGTSGTIYVDNLRLETQSLPDAIWNLNANGYAHGNALAWRPVNELNVDAYRIYRSLSASGPFEFIDSLPGNTAEYLDPQPSNNTTRYYYQVTYTAGGNESAPSPIVSALYNGLTDDELMDQIQWATFRYFWDGSHPVSGLAREGINTGHGADVVTMGGSGFGLMAIVVAVERGWITRSEAADHLLNSLTFLEETADRFHGVWPHWMNGTTGATIPFSPEDDGADLVESSFLMQGMLVVRQYFDDPVDEVETEIRTRINRMWEEMEWTWFRRFPGSDVLYWHWSPNFGWAMNFPLLGWYEATITYMLAVASPTFAMPGSSYINGWTVLPSYANGNSYYGITLDVGPPFGGPLFWTHYSNLGFDPRYKRDAFTNYFENNRNISLIHHAHCTNNPGQFVGYGPFCWGLTASRNPWGYSAHNPTNDNGTIAPTAALSAMPYTPEESLAALRHFYDVYGDTLLGTYGFKDAFNPTENWTDGGYLAIDQGPIVVMIENYRTGLIWDLFMSSPEIQPMMNAIGMYWEIDFNTDGQVNALDMSVFLGCTFGPDVSPEPTCTASFAGDSDLDNDGDIDSADYQIAQTIINAP